MDKITIYNFINMTEKLGGDLWNKYKFAAIVFSNHPEIKEFEYCLGSGLWCDIYYTDSKGNKKTHSIYESMKYKSKKEILDERGLC